MSPPSSSYMPVMSANAPAYVKVGDCVLPISTTSGVWSSDARAVWRRGTRPLQSCSSMTSFEPGFSFSKVVVR